MWHSEQNLPSLRVEIPWQQAAHGCPHLWCALPLATDVEPSVSCKHQARFQLIHWCSRRRRHQDPNFQTSYVIVLLQRLLYEDDNWLEVDSLRISFTLVEVVAPEQPLVQCAAWAFCPWASFGTRRLVQPLCMSHIKKSLLFSKFRCAKNKSLQWPWRTHPSRWLIAFGGYFPLATWTLASDSRMIQVAWNLSNKFATFSPLHQAPWTVE